MNKTYSYYYSKLSRRFDLDFESLYHFLKNKKGEILEVGSGDGRLSQLDVNNPFYLLEYDLGMFNLLNKNCANRKDLFPIKGNALKLPLDNDKFSAVIYAANSISEMSPLNFTLSECFRVLKPGGQVYVFVENPETYQEYNSPIKHYKDGDDQFSYRISLNKVKGNIFLSSLEVQDNSKELSYSIKQFFPKADEWKRNMIDIGFKNISFYGDYQGSPFLEKKSDYLIIIAEKETNTNDISNPTVEVYNSVAKKYSEIVANAKYFFPKKLEAEISKLTGANVRLLDLACANGYVGEQLSNNGVNVTCYGINQSKEMLKQCREKEIYQSVMQKNLKKGLAFLEYKYFDLITMFGLTEFISQKETLKLLKDMYHVLTDNGAIWVSFEEKKLDSKQDTKGIKRTTYSDTDVANLFQDTSFKISKTYYVPGYTSPSTGELIYYLVVIASKGKKV